MTRDPSDGSVREKGEENSKLSAPMPASEPGIDSGLPFASTKPEQQARLEKSREWIKGYHKPKDAT